MKIISVIIPIYNSEKYIERCIKSVCGQTYKNLEIICIDDGSLDSAGKILDECAARDNRIIAKHQTNHGESYARNEGLKLANGEYIAFVDCDDWLEPTMYEELVGYAEKYDLDMVASSWYKDDDNSSTAIKNQLEVDTGVFGRDDLLEYIYKRDYYRGFAYMWNKLYRRKTLEYNEREILKFDERLRLGGDVLFLAQAALRTKRAMYIDKPFYHYYQRSESGCHTKDLSKMREWIKAYEIIIKLMEQNHVSTEIINYIKRFMAYHSSNAAEMAIEQENITYKKEFQDIMKQYSKEYIELNKTFPERVIRYNKIMTFERG